MPQRSVWRTTSPSLLQPEQCDYAVARALRIQSAVFTLPLHQCGHGLHCLHVAVGQQLRCVLDVLERQQHVRLLLRDARCVLITTVDEHGKRGFVDEVAVDMTGAIVGEDGATSKQALSWLS